MIKFVIANNMLERVLGAYGFFYPKPGKWPQHLVRMEFHSDCLDRLDGHAMIYKSHFGHEKDRIKIKYKSNVYFNNQSRQTYNYSFTFKKTIVKYNNMIIEDYQKYELGFQEKYRKNIRNKRFIKNDII